MTIPAITAAPAIPAAAIPMTPAVLTPEDAVALEVEDAEESRALPAADATACELELTVIVTNAVVWEAVDKADVGAAVYRNCELNH